ncbi:MAG: hypothetical protein OXC97_04375 [Candidatus Dadabacteria bacterium]|nr:hypothetical protein [Candidatus Dadabacteria bacterium]
MERLPICFCRYPVPRVGIKLGAHGADKDHDARGQSRGEIEKADILSAEDPGDAKRLQDITEGVGKYLDNAKGKILRGRREYPASKRQLRETGLSRQKMMAAADVHRARQ